MFTHRFGAVLTAAEGVPLQLREATDRLSQFTIRIAQQFTELLDFSFNLLTTRLVGNAPLIGACLGFPTLIARISEPNGLSLESVP
jgi:hypothetical protein